MFEDLVKHRKGKYIPNANPNTCPYCKCHSVTQFAIRQLSPETYERPARCNICYKEWHIIYDKYMISATVVF